MATSVSALAACGSTGAPGEVGVYPPTGTGGAPASTGGLSSSGGANAKGGASAGGGAVPTNPMDGSVAAGGCRPGHYRGSYTGTYRSGMASAPISGAVTMTLVASDSHTLTLTEGLLQFDFLDAPIGLNLSGTLDCSTLQFSGQTLLYFQVKGLAFAEYDPTASAFVRGEWVASMDDAKPAVRGVAPDPGTIGVFTATFVAP